MLVKKSAKDVTADMIGLSEDGEYLLKEELSLLDAMMLMRHHKLPPKLKLDTATVCFHRRFWKRMNRYELQGRIRILSKELYAYMENEDMFRHDFDSERFIISSRFWALRRQVKKARPSCHSDVKYSINSLIAALSCDAYENWEGYDDKTINEIKNFLKKVLSTEDYRHICMRYGLNDNQPKSRPEIKTALKLDVSETAIRTREEKILIRLHEMPRFMELTEISPPESRD